MVAFVFLYSFTAFDTSVFALVIAMLAHVNIVIALSAIFAEMRLVFIIFHAHSVTAIGFGFTAIKTFFTCFAHFCHAEGHFTICADVLLPIA